MLFCCKQRSIKISVKMLVYTFMMLFWFGGFSFVNAEELLGGGSGWDIIHKDNSTYKEIQKNIIDIKKKTGKNMPAVDFQALVNEFNSAVNSDVNKVIQTLSQIMEEKDLKIADRVFKLIVKRIFKSYVPRILLDIFYDKDININELSHRIVWESVRSLVLRR